MQLNLTQTASGTLLPVKAKPNARKNEIRGAIDGALKVAVTATAEKGKANEAIVKLLAKLIAVPKSQVKLLAGGTISTKKFLISGVDPAELNEKLQQNSK